MCAAVTVCCTLLWHVAEGVWQEIHALELSAPSKRKILGEQNVHPSHDAKQMHVDIPRGTSIYLSKPHRGSAKCKHGFLHRSSLAGSIFCFFSFCFVSQIAFLLRAHTPASTQQWPFKVCDFGRDKLRFQSQRVRPKCPQRPMPPVGCRNLHHAALLRRRISK